MTDIQTAMTRIGECTIAHVLREANQVADGLAKFGLSLQCCTRRFDYLPPFLSVPFQADLAGIVFPRGL